jgi:RNA polymerase subunit RPABC4/transcription elongation factor Spt4
MVLHLLGLLLVLLATYWVFTDSRARGSELSLAFLWSAGVLLLPIVFLPLYLIFGRKTIYATVPPQQLPDTVIDVESTAITEIETTACPMCASQVNAEYKICPHCGYTLKPECQNCGARLDRRWTECPNCGAAAADK